MDTSKARRSARPYLMGSLDDLGDIGASRPKAPSLLSLDVFDTVLTRACGRPHDLFIWLGRRLATKGMINCSPELFAQVRANAEQAVWRREGGLDSKAGLGDFYVEVARRLHLDEQLVPQLAEAELSLEAEMLRAVPAARRLLVRCQEQGLPVVYTSDTYFPATFIEERLNSAGLWFSDSRCLVSSEHAEAKASGRLFDRLTSDNASPGQILHMGDHPHSDVAVPLRKGIGARWCVSGRLNKYEKILADAATTTAGFASSLAGASRMTRLATTATDDREAAIRDVAAGVAAPTLLGYVLWILKRAQELSLERLVFLARDGQILAELARTLVSRLQLPIEISYLYVSRKSTNLAATFSADEEETGWIFRDVPSLSIAKFLAGFDLQWDDVVQFLDVPEGVDATHPALQISESFHAQLTDGPLSGLILEHASRRREIVADYFRQEGLLDDVSQGIVDFGGVGSQVRAIHSLVKNAGGRAPRIFLIGLDNPKDAGLPVPDHEPDWVADTECYLYDHRRNQGIRRSRGFGTCVQMFCAADHGTVTSYHREGDTVVPDLAGRINKPMIDWGLNLYNTTLSAFAEHLVLDCDLVDPYADVRDVTCDLITELWTQPDRNEAAAWGSFPFEGAQASGGTSKSLVHRYTMRSICNEMIAGKFPNLGWQHWYEGSLAISGPAIRKGLKLAEAAYRSSEKKSGTVHTALVAGIRKLAGR
ncbi:hypothetical protein [Ruegeria sp. Ofav3-42]|uniref:HAD family hydrolase n=1 Tax=Ruegeria sp. Ofav3-42 TaxID=2917759 RepID=UPI001EF6E9DF|nr:hypothetical protein [Ruegeria sp. Ofav3-42]MCG7522385.1 hypothetical protein [Ruegeria sp. Ofav3-42]